MVILLFGMTGSAFAANPADLTLFDRFYPDGYIKLVYEGDDSKFASIRLPAFENDFSLYFRAWESKGGDCKKYTGRLIKRFSPFFDAALVSEASLKSGSSISKNRAVFDLHGDFLGNPIGIGLFLPFESDEDIKIGPRVSFGDFTTYFTVGKKDQYRLGLSYVKDGIRLDFAYDEEDIFYCRASKGFKTSFGKIYPELRMKFTPDEEFIGVGIGFKF